MTTAKATRYVLQQLGAGSTVLLSIHLALPTVPDWADGADADGRAVALVGRQQFGSSPDAAKATAAVLGALTEGFVPDGVVSVAYGPAASAFIAEVVAGHAEQVLADGPRASGKTMATPAALAILAELHVRAGYALPLRVSWLHDSLLNASVKTGASLEESLWGGLWTLRDDRRRAVLTVAGVEMVLGDFVGVFDQASAERLRAACHVVVGEELVPSLDESGGIEERKWDLARSSLLRLPARRRVAVGLTNPGDTDTWPYARWIAGGGQPGCVRCPIPASDRLTPDEVEAQAATFRGSPDLQRRLARGEWSSLTLGERVAEGFDPEHHVARGALVPSPNHLLAIGWDGGHSPSAVIGQVVNGQVLVYATLNDLKVGVLELIEGQVIAWLVQHAPWTRPRSAGAAMLTHIIDPSMSVASFGQASLHESAERVIQATLGGRIVKGPTAWSPRREAVLRVCAPRHEGGRTPLQIGHTPETSLLVKALGGRWYYPRTPDGRVDRSGAKKPNSPWSDVGDAFAYLCGWLVGDDGGTPLEPAEITVVSEFDPRALFEPRR